MSSENSWRVVCLCAAWCRTCDEYRPVFDALALEFADARFTWVDIEAQCELIDDFDVETFPALLIGQGPTLRFAGPLRPQPETLARLLRALLVSAAVVVQDAQAQALWLRLRHAD